MQSYFMMLASSTFLFFTYIYPDPSLQINTTTITIMLGDITKVTGYDAIVNAANTMLSHGAGVALAISNAAGPELQKYSFEKVPSMGQGMGEKCHVGQAVVTPAFKLEQNGVKWIIHAVGPRIASGKKPTVQDEKLLYNAYYNSLLYAQELKIKRIAFPSISTAIFGYDINLAAPIALRAITDFITQHPSILDTVTIVLFTQTDYDVYAKFLPGYNSLWQRFIAFLRTHLPFLRTT